jgi:CRP/FNR family transcriptional regulator, cyclic AMP receptor protein
MSKLKEMLAASLWIHSLTPEERRRVEQETSARPVVKGATVCRKGEPVDHWLGVIEGFATITMANAAGKLLNAIVVPAMGWFGEGSMLKDEPRRYDAVAVRDSLIAYMPRSTFRWLVDNNIGFVRFLLVQLNERLGQFIGTVESDRLLGPDERVAHCLASMFNPILYPGMPSVLQISQEEIGNLVGLSRQRVNRALKTLEDAGLLQIDYGGIRVKDVAGLFRFETKADAAGHD